MHNFWTKKEGLEGTPKPFAGDKFVATFGGKYVGWKGDEDSGEDRDAPAYCAKNPCGVEFPTDEETVVVVI